MEEGANNKVWPPPPLRPDLQGQNHSRKTLTLLITWLAGLSAAIGVLPALEQGAEALGRFALFLFDCGGRLGMNHVGAEVFTSYYQRDYWLVPIGAISVALAWQGHKKLRRFAMSVCLANLLGGLAFYLMHISRVLVTYNEYIGR